MPTGQARVFWLTVVAAVVLPAQAGGHLAPDATRNNRYAKLVLLPGAVRVAYTVYFGERPGADERRRMDKDGDGVISDAERDDFARAALRDVAPAIYVEVDGSPTRAAWSVADVGLGTPSAAGGSFSVDLAVMAPVPDPSATTHVVYLEDRWPAPLPGDYEVRVEESPGVRVVEAHPGRAGRGAQLRFAFSGLIRRPEEAGIFVRFTVDPELAAAAARDAAGPTPASAGDAPRGPTRRDALALAVILLLLGVVVGVAAVRE